MRRVRDYVRASGTPTGKNLGGGGSGWRRWAGSVGRALSSCALFALPAKMKLYAHAYDVTHFSYLAL